MCGRTTGSFLEVDVDSNSIFHLSQQNTDCKSGGAVMVKHHTDLSWQLVR